MHSGALQAGALKRVDEVLERLERRGGFEAEVRRLREARALLSSGPLDPVEALVRDLIPEPGAFGRGARGAVWRLPGIEWARSALARSAAERSGPGDIAMMSAIRP